MEGLDWLHILLIVICATLAVALVMSTLRQTPRSNKATRNSTAPDHTQADKEAANPVVNAEADRFDSACQLLAIFQQEARLVDFFKQELAGHTDEQIGAAARVIHQGGKKCLDKYVQIEAIESQAEGSNFTLEAGFSPSDYRMTGNITGNAPFHGILVHKGWRITDIHLPEVNKGHDCRIIKAAEVELV